MYAQTMAEFYKYIYINMETLLIKASFWYNI